MSIADELITRGWIQGTLERDGGVCLRGAINYAIAGNARLTATLPQYSTWVQLERAAEAVRTVLKGYDIEAWNDTPGRTFDEVLRVAKEADEILDAQS